VYAPWDSGGVVHGIQRLGGALFLSAIVASGVLALRRSAGWQERRFAVLGVGSAVMTVGAFLASVMVMDLFSSRYLAALVLLSPFALVPLAGRLTWSQLLALLAPFLFGAGLSGWVGFGNEVRGPRVATLPGHGAADERALIDALEERGIRDAVADYWVSYRLTFLAGEQLRVVPIHEREDRYAPYRADFLRASRAAYVFDPERSRENLASFELGELGVARQWGAPRELLHFGRLVAVVFDRPQRAGSASLPASP
jgi:hypothetical protein